MGQGWNFKSEAGIYDAGKDFRGGVRAQTEKPETGMKILTAIPKPPTRENELRRWIQGGALDKWADESQADVIEAATDLQIVLKKTARMLVEDQKKLEQIKACEFLPEETTMELEARLDARVEKAAATLQRVADIRGKLTEVSKAAIIAAITRPHLERLGAELGETTMRDANPRRRANVTAVDIMGDDDLTGEGG
jgi:hypothetical protein